MKWFRGHYLGTMDDAKDWRASPLLAPDLAGVAPAIVIAAECDVLHDEGLAYATLATRVGPPGQKIAPRTETPRQSAAPAVVAMLRWFERQGGAAW